MTSLIHSMSRGGWRAYVLVFNPKGDVCFEIRNGLRHLSFQQGKVSPAWCNSGLCAHILRI